jgi:hypothetical protein
MLSYYQRSHETIFFLPGANSNISQITNFLHSLEKYPFYQNQRPNHTSFHMKIHTFEQLCVLSRYAKCFGYILFDQLGVLVLYKNFPLFHVFQTVSS